MYLQKSLPIYFLYVDHVNFGIISSFTNVNMYWSWTAFMQLGGVVLQKKFYSCTEQISRRLALALAFSLFSSMLLFDPQSWGHLILSHYHLLCLLEHKVGGTTKHFRDLLSFTPILLAPPFFSFPSNSSTTPTYV